MLAVLAVVAADTLPDGSLDAEPWSFLVTLLAIVWGPTVVRSMWPRKD